MNKPSLEEVDAYCQSRGNTVDPVNFWNHYESNGWYVGKVPMKNWKAAVHTWERMAPRFQRTNERADKMQREANVGVWRPS